MLFDGVEMSINKEAIDTSSVAFGTNFLLGVGGILYLSFGSYHGELIL